MSPPKRRRKLAAVVLLLALAGSLALWRFQRSGELDRWQARLIEHRLREFSGLLPFEIESIVVRKSWKELFSGKVAQLEIHLRRDAWRVKLRGPLNAGKIPDGSGYRVEYLPEALLERADLPDRTRSAALPLRLWASVGPNFVTLTGLGLETRSGASWDWPFFELRLEEPFLAFSWREGAAAMRGQVKTANWGSEARMASLQELRLALDAPMTLQPFSLGPALRGTLASVGGEALWKDRYLDLPLKLLPVRFAFDAALKKADIGIGEGASPPLSLQADLPRGRLHWRLSPLPLKGLLEQLRKTAGGALKRGDALLPLLTTEIRDGRLQSKGELAFRDGAFRELEGTVKISQAAVRIPEAYFAARGAGLELELSSRTGASGLLSAETLLFRAARARLRPTDFTITPREKPAPGSLLARDYELSIGESAELPFEIEGLPLSIQSLVGNLSPPSGDEPLDFTLQSSLRLESTPAARLLSLLCLPMKRVPPATIEVDFPRVDLGPDWLEPEGKIRAALFDGVAELGNLSLSHIGSATPELGFDASLSGIRLDKLGAWLGLGKVDGLIEGEATGVSFLSWLPIRYYFRLEAKPLKRDKIVFSAPAMKNFLKLISSDDTIDKIPDPGGFAFGFIRKFVGGYDLDYAGIVLSAADGFIQVRTLDRKRVLKESRESGRHFILYGKSKSGFTEFTMPLPGPNYPLIVSAPAMSDYLRALMFRLGMLKPEPGESVNSTLTEEPTHEDLKTCDPPAL
ncbi:MAG: hypothetical protein NDJ89_06815 [Oligoflexia bacterium]|nr:hypothetical protein [Oligoflexia bacterium]